MTQSRSAERACWREKTLRSLTHTLSSVAHDLTGANTTAIRLEHAP